jgi:hypothetical protein
VHNLLTWVGPIHSSESLCTTYRASSFFLPELLKQTTFSRSGVVKVTPLVLWGISGVSVRERVLIETADQSHSEKEKQQDWQ